MSTLSRQSTNPGASSVRALIYGFDRPHRVGSICGEKCEQCGGQVEMSGPGAMGMIATVPMLIVRKATREEYIASVAANGGGSDPRHLASVNHYFYEVSVD